MSRLFSRVRVLIGFALISCLCSPVVAALPAPPDQLNITDGNYATGLISYGLTIMGYGCYLLAGLAFMFIGHEMISAYQEAKRLEKLSHFFIWALVGVFTLAICLGLLYAGNTLIVGVQKP
jgi:hypothetical protein